MQRKLLSVDLIIASGATLTIDADATGWGQLKVSGSILNNGTIVYRQYLDKNGIFGVASPMDDGFTTTMKHIRPYWVRRVDRKLFYRDFHNSTWKWIFRQCRRNQ